MLRLNEVKLPLDHAAGDIEAAILPRLGIPDDAARLHLVQAQLRCAQKVRTCSSNRSTCHDEAAVLQRSADDRNVNVAPDSYKVVGQASAHSGKTRPVVIGTGPCGLFAGLLLAQMGFRPIILERGKVVRERTKDTWGLWRKRVLDPGIQRAVRRRRRRHLLRRQALQPDQGPAASTAARC